MWLRLRSESGQGTVEYVGAVLLVAAIFGTVLATTGLAQPAANLGGRIADRLVCAVRPASSCKQAETALAAAYGDELSTLVGKHAPDVRFEPDDFVSLPIDPRECRHRSCADSSELGPLGRSFEDYPATAFVRVADCRAGATQADIDCSGDAAGKLYLQYWLFYPDSATKPFGSKGYHLDDWESYQVRIRPGGDVDARASSHKGYNHDPDPISDVFGGAGGWGSSNGYVWVSAGSHAGRAAGDPGGTSYRSIPADRLHLLPLEAELDSLGRLDYAVTPPWLKKVWIDPEETGT